MVKRRHAGRFLSVFLAALCLTVFQPDLHALAQQDDAAELRLCIDSQGLKSKSECSRLWSELFSDRRRIEQLADQLIDRGQYQEAVHLLARGIEKFPEATRLRTLHQYAKSFTEEEQQIAAREKAQNSATAQNLELEMVKVRCKRMSGQEALSACDTALASDPLNDELLSAKGDLLVADGKVVEALTVFTEVMRLRPDDLLARQKVALLGGKVERRIRRTESTTVRGNTATAGDAGMSADSVPKPVMSTNVSPAKIGGAKPATADVKNESAAREVNDDSVDQRLEILGRLFRRGLVDQREYDLRRKAILDSVLEVKTLPNDTAGSPVIEKTDKSSVSKINFGNYHALVIGINNYQFLPKLETALADAQSVAALLKDKYGFQVKLLLDPAREQVIEAFDIYRERLESNDNLLVYYAGHGWLDKESQQGFWLPVDAKVDRRSQWISNNTVREAALALKAKHLLVMADSCFSGTLTRSIRVTGVAPKTAKAPKVEGNQFQLIVEKRARMALTSGGLEPVADSSGGKNSPFAKAMLDALNDNRGVLTGADLFKKIKRPVELNSDQKPDYSDIRRAGHEGGDFVFVRKP